MPDIQKKKEQLKAELIKALNTLFDALDTVYYDDTIHNFVYYYGVNYYAQYCEPGFDLLVSKDGVNFDAITRDGFGSEKNHGLRTIGSTEQGVYLGTANPFQGTQLWRMFSDRDLKLDIDPTATRYKIKVTTDGNGTAAASQKDAVEGKYVTLTATPNDGYRFDHWEVITPTEGLTIKRNQFRMPGQDVEIKACFVSDGTKPSESPEPSESPNPSPKPSESPSPEPSEKPMPTATPNPTSAPVPPSSGNNGGGGAANNNTSDPATAAGTSAVQTASVPTPQTGDTFHLNLWIGLAVLSLLGLAGIAVKKKAFTRTDSKK